MDVSLCVLYWAGWSISKHILPIQQRRRSVAIASSSSNAADWITCTLFRQPEFCTGVLRGARTGIREPGPIGTHEPASVEIATFCHCEEPALSLPAPRPACPEPACPEPAERAERAERVRDVATGVRNRGARQSSPLRPCHLSTPRTSQPKRVQTCDNAPDVMIASAPGALR